MSENTNLSTRMGKNPATKRVEAHLMPEDYEALKKLALEKKWSLKKYVEDLIEIHLKEKRKKSK